MSVLFTTANLGLEGFVPNTNWLSFNSNWTKIDAWFKNNIIDDNPNNRIISAFDLVKKAGSFVTSDSISVDVLQAWEENILNYESPIIEDGSHIWNYQMIASDINLGSSAGRSGPVFTAEIPTIASSSDNRGTSKDINSIPISLHYDFGPIYDSDKFIKSLDDDDEYVIAYESASSDYSDITDSPTAQYYDPYSESTPSGLNGIPGLLWDGFENGGTISTPAVVASDAFSNEFVPGLSGINKYFESDWTTGDDEDFFGELNNIRPPGYLEYRTFCQDMYNVVLLYRSAVEHHLENTLPDRMQSFKSSVITDLDSKTTQLSSLVSDAADEVSNELYNCSYPPLNNRCISNLEEEIEANLHLSNDYIVSSGDFSGYRIDDAIEILEHQIVAHSNNEMMVEVKDYDDIIDYSSVEVKSGDVNGVHDVEVVGETIGTVRDSDVITLGNTRTVDGAPVGSVEIPTGWQNMVTVNNRYMFVKFTADNPHYVHASPSNEYDQGIVTDLNITYTSGD